MEGSLSPARWYVAVLILRAELSSAPEAVALLDHQVRLLRAIGAERAYDAALALGAAEEHSYENAAGEEVRWRFAGLADLDEVAVETLTDGIEVYSWRSHEAPAAAVVPKAQLTIFASAADAERTAAELLN